MRGEETGDSAEVFRCLSAEEREARKAAGWLMAGTEFASETRRYSGGRTP